MTIGILDCAVVMPRATVSRRAIAEATGGSAGPGERRVANHDEDSVTLMVEAALAVAGDGLPEIDLVISATTTSPCLEKSVAALIVDGADGSDTIATLDLAGPRRCGLEALHAAEAAVRAGSVRRVLVCVADVRPVEPRSTLEARVTDAACAFLVGSGDLLASFESWGHAHAEAWEVWRREGEPIQGEDSKAAREVGFERPVAAALARARVEHGSVSRLALAAPDARAAQAVAKKLGVRELFSLGDLGDAGCATAPILLARALAGASDGTMLAACAYGDGARAVKLRAGARAASFSLAAPDSRSITYLQTLVARGVIGNRPPSPEVSTSLLAMEGDAISRLRGARCPRCSVVTYPPATLCVSCGSGELEHIRLRRRGSIFTFTRDHLFDASDPVTCMCVVDLEQGGRVYVQATDCSPEEVAIGAAVELVFRRIHDGGGHPNYSWKCRPLVARR